MNASQMMAEMRKLSQPKPTLLPEDGWFTSHELTSANGGNMSNSSLKKLLARAKEAGRLEEAEDWRQRRDGKFRKQSVYRLNLEGTEGVRDE